VVQEAGIEQVSDDWQNLDLARGGDEAAWRTLFGRYFPPLARMTAQMTGSLEMGNDLAQEAFVHLLRADIRHRNGSFKAFLSTIAYRLALKARHRQQEALRVDPDCIADESPSPLEKAIRDETDRIIVRVIQSLSIEQKEILTLRYFGEHSYEEITEITGIPIGTVKSRIFYAIKACQEKLKNRGVFK
jgi:RNA polymerase sigma-70 factor (ECF subfamily)